MSVKDATILLQLDCKNQLIDLIACLTALSHYENTGIL